LRLIFPISLPLSSMTTDQLLSSLTGLSVLGAQPNPFWMKATLLSTLKHMAGHTMMLSELGRLAVAMAGEAMGGTRYDLKQRHLNALPFIYRDS